MIDDGAVDGSDMVMEQMSTNHESWWIMMNYDESWWIMIHDGTSDENDMMLVLLKP